MPFCPDCHTEYGSGTEICKTCNTRLVQSPSQETGDADAGSDTLVELATFSNVSEAEMIKELLEKNEIPTIQRGEVDPIGVASGAEPITLLVEARDLPRARELHEAYFAGNDVEDTQSDLE